MQYFTGKQIVRHTVLAAALVSTLALATSCKKIDNAETVAATEAGKLAFRNAVTDPPPGTKKFFKLSSDYPTTLPATCKGCDWQKIKVDFSNQPPGKVRDWDKDGWGDYLDAMLAYVRQGQDPNLSNDVGFRPSLGGKTRWFNVPWMAFDERAGREYIHGATNERTLFMSDFEDGSDLPKLRTSHYLRSTSPSIPDKCKVGFESWSVGYYNDIGGYALGKAIPKVGAKSGVPQLSAAGDTLDGLPFPEGTLVMKILTTSAPVECAPFLEGSPEWTVDRHKADPTGTVKGGFLCEREPQVSRVVQLDVAVRDKRSPSGWVYGTYAYNSKMGGKTFWDNLMPLGLQWGSDPTVFPAVATKTTPPVLQQTILAPYSPAVKIFQHGGCEGRLAGPADNAQSSCVSCHSSAFSTKPGVLPVMGQNVPPSFGFPGLCTTPSPENTAYFQTIKAPARYSDPKYASAISLDTSLQLAVSMNQYAQFATSGSSKKCVDTKVDPKAKGS